MKRQRHAFLTEEQVRELLMDYPTHADAREYIEEPSTAAQNKYYQYPMFALAASHG